MANGDSKSGLSTTAVLLHRAKAGDRACREALAKRCEPRLRRMARGRLPAALAATIDPEDIVQETLLRAFTRIESFEPRCDGAFLFYLRRILMNLIVDLTRKSLRRHVERPLDHEPPACCPSPVEEAVGREMWGRYEEAVEKLTARQREAVVLYVECGMSFEEIAQAFGEETSREAARLVVVRGLKKLADWMRVEA